MLRFIGRLMLHGPRLVWRIFAILLGVAGGSMWEAVKSIPAPSDDDHGGNASRNHPGGIFSHYEAEDAFHRGQIGAAELAYFSAMDDE